MVHQFTHYFIRIISNESCCSDVLFDELVNEVLSKDESTGVMEEFLPHPLNHFYTSMAGNGEEGTVHIYICLS